MATEKTTTLRDAQKAFDRACAACDKAYAARDAARHALARAIATYQEACAARIAADDALTKARAKKERNRCQPRKL
jgi:ribosomal protein S9